MPKEPTKATLKALGALSGNVCAFPSCPAPIYDTLNGKLVGQVCHIKAESIGGPRYNSLQSEDDRHGLGNLIYMCRPHHAVIDDPGSLQLYTVEYLIELKGNHESRAHNTIFTEEYLEQFVDRVLERIGAAPERARAEPVIAPPRVSINHHMTIDTYDFSVRLRNTGEKRITDFRIEVHVPAEFAPSSMASSVTYVPPKQHGIEGIELFRLTPERCPDFTLYPRNTSRDLLSVDFELTWERYKQPITESILICVYAADDLVSEAYFPIESLLNRERLAAFRELADSLHLSPPLVSEPPEFV